MINTSIYELTNSGRNNDSSLAGREIESNNVFREPFIIQSEKDLKISIISSSSHSSRTHSMLGEEEFE